MLCFPLHFHRAVVIVWCLAQVLMINHASGNMRVHSFAEQFAVQGHASCACILAQTRRPAPRRALNVECSSTRRRQLAVLHALSPSASTVYGTNVGSESFEQLLHALSTCSVPELRQHMQQNPDDVTLSFLQWLASREDELEGNPKLKLAVLAGQLLALREGLDPCEFDEVADELQEQWQASAHLSDQQLHQTPSQEQQQPPNQNQQHSGFQHINRETAPSDAVKSELFPSTPSKLQQSLVSADANRGIAGNAFSETSVVRQAEQVRLLNLDVQQARAQSTVQLIGRKQIGASDPLQVSGAAHRILEYLMGLATAEMRREVLPEAFEAPGSGMVEEKYEASSEGSDAETEQLSTTPLQLLQAVDLELAWIRNRSGTDAAGSNLLIPGEESSVERVRDALQQLRADVLAQWDA